MIKVLHRETVSDIHRLRARLPELQAKYPAPATVTYRRAPRFAGWNVIVKGEGEATRTRSRGHCQFCGNPQVIKNGRLVKHGYKRPGTGYEVGRCPGAGEQPLQVTDEQTHGYLSQERWTLANLQATQPTIEGFVEIARQQLDESDEVTYSARLARPRKPSRYDPLSQHEAHHAALIAWEKAFPKYAALVKAEDRASAGRTAIGQSEAFITHFEHLIALKLVGTELLTEEVA